MPGPFDMQQQIPIAAIIEALQRKPVLEAQMRQQQNQDLLQGINTAAQGVDSFVQTRRNLANAMNAGAKNLQDLPNVQAKRLGGIYGLDPSETLGLTPNQVEGAGKVRAGKVDMNTLMMMMGKNSGAPTPTGTPPPAGGAPSPAGNASIRNIPPASPLMTTGLQQFSQSPQQQPQGQQQMGAPSPQPGGQPPTPPSRFVNPATLKLGMQLRNATRPQAVISQDDALNAGSVPKGTRIINTRQGNGQDTSSPAFQSKLENQYAQMKMRALSNRSGGLGLEDAKVNQAIHLRQALNTSYNPTTHEYTIPPTMHSELAMGLAKLVSPTGQVGIQQQNEIMQSTAREGLAKTLINMGFDPREVGGTTQSVAKFLASQIDRQGLTAEQNREGAMQYIHGQAPSELDPSRIAKHDKIGLNSFNKLLVDSPDQEYNRGIKWAHEHPNDPLHDSVLQKALQMKAEAAGGHVGI